VSVYGDAHYALDQGYLLDAVPVRFPRSGEDSVEQSLAVVTSHGCDCDRYERAKAAGDSGETLVVQVAPVHPLAALDDNGLHNDIRKGGVHRYFHIPAEAGHDELVADLFFEQPLPTGDLMRLVRVASLSEDWCWRLSLQIFVLRSRKRIEDVFRDDAVPKAGGER
jgi:hypothetical protein